jgi:hypothetical protein
MDKNTEPGNKNLFGSPSQPSSRGRENAIIDKTKNLAFPDGAVLSLENFEHYGDRPAGWQNSIAEMQGLNGKELQESYRSGLSQSATYHDKVTDR